jgi:hypothetical protein
MFYAMHSFYWCCLYEPYYFCWLIMMVWQKYNKYRFFGLIGSGSWVFELSGDLVSWNFSRVTYNFLVTNVFILLQVAIWKWNFLTLDMNLIRIYSCLQMVTIAYYILQEWTGISMVTASMGRFLLNLGISRYVNTSILYSRCLTIIFLSNWLGAITGLSCCLFWISSSSYYFSKTMTCAT